MVEDSGARAFVEKQVEEKPLEAEAAMLGCWATTMMSNAMNQPIVSNCGYWLYF